MKSSSHRRQEHLETLIQEIETLKTTLDQKHAEYLDLSQGLEAFSARYTQYIESLDKQKFELQGEIQRCRSDIRNLKNPQKPLPEPTVIEDTDLDDGASSLPSQEERVQNDTETAPIDAASDDKTRLRRHFVHFWHPDRRPENGELMLALNTAFNGSQDVVDMMIAIPWHEAWIQPGEQEPWRDRLGRLTDWKFYLEEGLERVEQRLAELQQNPRYPGYQKWDSAGRETDYFATLSEQQRQEIQRLEQTLATLQAELAKMQMTSPAHEESNE